MGIDSDRIALWTVRLQPPREIGGRRAIISRLDGIHALDGGIPRITSSTACMPQPRAGPPIYSLVTGHQDGSVRFWRATLSVTLIPFCFFFSRINSDFIWALFAGN